MRHVTDMDAMLLRIIKGIEEAKPVGAHRRDLWERCWAESPSVPTYFTDVVRVDGKLYEAPGYERTLFENLRRGLYARWIGGCEHVSEFGCGTGHNLQPLQEAGKVVHGYDWAESAVERVRADLMDARIFNMFVPKEVDIEGHAVLTIHSMEQLGAAWGAFLKFLRDGLPQIVVHIEPVEEMYDPENLLDYLALQYHRKRGYLAGYYTELRRLEAENEIEILEARRGFFGSLFHEAYSVIVWRPAPRITHSTR